MSRIRKCRDSGATLFSKREPTGLSRIVFRRVVYGVPRGLPASWSYRVATARLILGVRSRVPSRLPWRIGAVRFDFGAMAALMTRFLRPLRTASVLQALPPRTPSMSFRQVDQPRAR